LGQVFCALVLLPTSLILSLVVIVESSRQGVALPEALLGGVTISVMVQMGYVLGLLARIVPKWSRRVAKSAPRPPVKHEVRHF
jgi:hypothetical protein